MSSHSCCEPGRLFVERRVMTANDWRTRRAGLAFASVCCCHLMHAEEPCPGSCAHFTYPVFALYVMDNIDRHLA